LVPRLKDGLSGPPSNRGMRYALTTHADRVPRPPLWRPAVLLLWLALPWLTATEPAHRQRGLLL